MGGGPDVLKRLAWGVMMAGSLVAACAEPAAAPSEPELGAVRWLREFDQAQARARAEHVPMLVLFTEVPGCATCVNYGGEVLRHPLLVEAAETLFVPVLVRNNVDGREREVLESFGEPALNNPVVRIIDGDRAMLAPRVADDFSAGGLARAMVQALEKAEPGPPAYLRAAADEATSAGRATERALLSVTSADEAESVLASVRGVVGSRIGTSDGREVIELTFDPAMLRYADLLREARRAKLATRVHAFTSEQHAAAQRVLGDIVELVIREPEFVERPGLARLMNGPYRGVPMGPVQARRVNAALMQGADPDALLSARQVRFRGLAMRGGDSWPTLAGRSDLRQAFDEVERAAAELNSSAR